MHPPARFSAPVAGLAFGITCGAIVAAVLRVASDVAWTPIALAFVVTALVTGIPFWRILAQALADNAINPMSDKERAVAEFDK